MKGLVSKWICAAWAVVLTAALCGCGRTEAQPFGIAYDEVSLDYGSIALTELEAPKELKSMQELSDFMDYCVFYGERDEVQYASLAPDYARTVKADAYDQYRWAGQYGNLAHNFVTGYDDSRLDEGLFGVTGGFVPYGFKSYTLEENNERVVNYEYYADVLSRKGSRAYSLKDFALYRSNRGFIRVSNSEQLFYAAAQGYMPVPDGDDIRSLLSRVLGILNRIFREDMTELEKLRAIYSYLVCENTYDYESFYFKDSKHTDYSAYFLEGVFNSRNAVCDGLAKAMVLMCRLEGIEAYHIGAVGSAGGHAYTYVRADGSYYLCCPTQASSVTKLGSKRYHCHTYAFMLTDYQTSSPAWDYYSDQLPEIGELVRQTEKYDHWSSYTLEIDGARYDLSPEDASSAVAVLEHVARAAEEYGHPMQIELLCSYEVSDEAYRTVRETYRVHKINNGVFEGKRLYAFVFGVKE